jgi:hypothetical protein
MSNGSPTWLDKFFTAPVQLPQAQTTASLAATPITALVGAGEVSGAWFLPNTGSTPTTGSNSQTLQLLMYDNAGNPLGVLASAILANGSPMLANVRFPLAVSQTGLANYLDGYVIKAQTAVTGSATLPQGVWVVEI